MDFEATIAQTGKTTTGIPVPDEVMTQLGSSKKPAVVVTINGYTYRSTVGTMGGQRLVPLSAEHRKAAGVAGGETVTVGLVLDEAPRETTLPEDLAAAFAENAPAATFFETLSPSYKKEWVRWIEDAKKPETRATRLAKTIEGLTEGKKTH